MENLTNKDFTSDQEVRWCPGCGDYAILRAIPDKLGGVLFMFGAIAVLFILPWLDRSPVRSSQFRPIFKIFFWVFSWMRSYNYFFIVCF